MALASEESARRQARPKRSVQQRIRSGVSWTLAGSVAVKALGAVSGILLARILQPEGYGQYGIVLSTVAMFTVYGGFRLANTSIKYVSEYRHGDPERAARVLKLALTVSLGLCAVAGLVVSGLAPMLATRMLERPELTACLALAGLLVLFQGYESIVSQTLQGFEDFKSVARINVVRALLVLAVCVPMAALWGVQGAILGLAVVAACVLPQSFYWLRRNQASDGFPPRTSLREAIREWPILWHFALPGFLTLVVISSVNWIGKLILTRSGGGFSAVGLFEAASQWMGLAQMIPAMMASVLLPVLSDSHGRNDAADYRAAFSLQLRAIMIVSLPLTAGMMGFSRYIAALYGSRFAGTDTLIPIVVVSGFVQTFTMALRVNYESKARQWTNLVLYALWAAILLTAAVGLVPRLGAFGLGMAMLLAECILLMVTAIHLSRTLLPGFLNAHFPHFLFCLVLLLAVCVSGMWLGPRASMAAAGALTVLSLVPLVRQARRSGLVLQLSRALRSEACRKSDLGA